MTGFAHGTALLLGVLLASAGALKLATPGDFEHALRRLLPARLDSMLLVRVAARAVPAAELLVGGCLLATPWVSYRFGVIVATAAVALYSGFVGVIAIAIRKGTACGCWSSFSDSVAGGAELGRALALAALAAAMLAVEAVRRPASGWRWVDLAFMAGAFAVVAAAAMVGSRLLPHPDRNAREPRTAAGTVGAEETGAKAFVGLIAGRVAYEEQSSPAGMPKVSSEEELMVLRELRSSASLAKVVELLGDRAAGVRWGEVAVHKTTGEGSEGRASYLLLPETDDVGLHVIASVTVEGGTATECTVIGSVDGRPFHASRGEIQLGPEPAVS